MAVVIGFRRVAAYKKNGSNYDSLVSASIRSAASLVFSEKRDLKDHRERVLPTFMNAKATYKDYTGNRPSLAIYNALAGYNGGINFEFLSERTGASSYDGIYKFDKMGLAYAYNLTDKERFMEITGEADYEIDRFKQIIDNAQLNTPESFPLTPVMEYNSANYKRPNVSSILIANSELFTREEIKDIKVKISNDGPKNYLNVMNTAWIKVNIEIGLVPTPKAKIKALLEANKYPAVNLNFGLNNTGLEKHNFEEGVLSLSREFNNADDKNEPKIYLEGKIPYYGLSSPTETGNEVYNYAL